MSDSRTEMSYLEYREMIEREQRLTVPAAPAPKRMNTEPQSKLMFREFLFTGDYGPVIEEHRFHPTRRWRFDWFLPDHNVAFEYDGIHGGAHTAIAMVLKDSDKINEAQAMGIRVFRVNTRSIQDGSAFDLVRRVLERGEANEKPGHHAGEMV